MTTEFFSWLDKGGYLQLTWIADEGSRRGFLISLLHLVPSSNMQILPTSLYLIVEINVHVIKVFP